MSNADTTLNMLTLFVRISTKPDVQALASELQHGFTQVIWDTLHKFKVLDARITAIKSAKDPSVFESLILCTTFQMPNIEYQRVFYQRFPGTFIKLALAEVDSRFEEQLTREQLLAVKDGDESEANRQVLQPLFDKVRAWIDAHDLTLDRKPALRPEPGERNQFHLMEGPKVWPSAEPASAAASPWGSDEAAAQ